MLPIVVLIAFGVTLGLRRNPVYSASAEIQVGVTSVSAQSTPGYVVATETLASAYSRQLKSQAVYQRVSREAGLSPAVVASRVSSSAVPSSPTFFINATGPSRAAAIALTTAATAALRHEVNSVQQQEGRTAALLHQYSQAQTKADQLTDQQTLLQGRLIGNTPANKAAVRAVRVQAQVAQLQAQVLSAQYQAAATSTSGSTIQVLVPPGTVSNDRKSITERYGLIGAAAGIVLGALLAMLAEWVRQRRRIPIGHEPATDG